VAVLVGVVVAVVAFRVLDRTLGDRRSERSPTRTERRASPVLWFLWGVVATGCFFMFVYQEAERVAAAVVLLLAGLWAFGGTHRLPLGVRWGIGIATMIGTTVVGLALFLLVLALGRGWLGEQALEGDDPRFSVVVTAPIAGPIDYDFDQPDPPALLVGKADARALGVDRRIEGRTAPGRAEWRINTDWADTADVEHCFTDDVLFEGSDQVAVPAETCASGSAPSIESELP
jgi:hypothetical protein